MAYNFQSIQDNNPIIYLYNLPKAHATSVKIAEIMKKVADYDLKDPVQFKDYRPNVNTGLPSPFVKGIIKIDPADLPTVAAKLKYFEFKDNEGSIWNCSSQPYEKRFKELLLHNNVFIRNIPADTTPAQLEEKFKEFGEVKSVMIVTAPALKVNTTPEGKKSLEVDESKPPTNVGHGFVMFKDAESVNKALAAGSKDVLQIVKCRPKEARTDINKVYNNIYIKNLPNHWDIEKIKEIFSHYGDIKSAFVDTKKDKDGNDRKFAFVCYDRQGDANYGRECARKAVEDLHDKEVEGNKLYVQPFLPFAQRQAQVKRDQLRFKNSKKKCNLFVKGFPVNYNEEMLRGLFREFGEIESVKILQSNEITGNSTRAFICFKQPDSAVQARARLHGTTVGEKQLFITNYELPEVRKRQQVDMKDKTDFMNFRKQSAPVNIDPALLQRPESLHLIQYILMLLQKSLNGRTPQFNNNRQGTMGYNGPKPRTQRLGQPMIQQPSAQPIIPQQQIAAQPQVLISTTGIVGGPQAALPHPDPYVNNYNQRGFLLLPAIVPENPQYKSMVGDFIFDYVEKLVGPERAPKITGMLIDLHMDEIKAYLYDFSKLYQKIGEAINLLSQQPQVTPQ